MKFYIGSSFKNCGLVNYFLEKLEPNGWKYTYNLSKISITMKLFMGILNQ